MLRLETVDACWYLSQQGMYENAYDLAERLTVTGEAG